MKASELIEQLQQEIESFGDREVVFYCSCVEVDEPIEIGALGWYGDVKNGNKINLICAECNYQALIEKHMFDGEPDEFEYPT